MSWTTPRTYVVDENVTATIFNTDHRDNLREVYHAKGSSSFSIAAANSTTVVVNHGLTLAPTSVQLTAAQMMEVAGTFVMMYVTTITSTQFTINVKLGGGGSGTISGTIYWAAFATSA